jgi:hypothetical protein
MALIKTNVEAIQIHKLLYELGFLQVASTTIYSNNQSAIAFTVNPIHSRSKHIAIQYHFTCDQILVKQILIAYGSKYDS